MAQLLVFASGNGGLYTGETRELWVTDGTANGTRQLTGLTQGSIPMNVGLDAAIAGDKIVFEYTGRNNLGHHIREIWTSDGTVRGTERIATDAEFAPVEMGEADPYVGGSFTMSAGADLAEELNGRMFLGLSELYRGSRDDIALLKDLNPGFDERYESRPDQFVAIGEKLVFSAQSYVTYPSSINYTTSIGRQLFVTDGTSKGTKSVLRPGETERPVNPHLSESGLIGDKLVFFDDATGVTNDLWVTDGTGRGTKKIADFSHKIVSDFISFDGDLFFWKDSYLSPVNFPMGELWRTDGTKKGTKLVLDIDDLPTPSAKKTIDFGTIGGGPDLIKEAFVAGDQIIFRAYVDNREAYFATDGTPGDVQVLFGPNISDLHNLYDLGWFNGKQIIQAVREFPGLVYNENGVLIGDATYETNYYAFDPTDGSTKLLVHTDGHNVGAYYLPGFPTPAPLAVLDDLFVFSVREGDMVSLYSSKGTAKSTTLLTTMDLGDYDSADLPFLRSDDRIVNGNLLFTKDGALWVTDGTLKGTGPLADMPDTPRYLFPLTILGEETEIIEGTNRKDRLIGDANDEILLGKGKADVLRGGGSNDELNGGIGRDKLFGDAGADRLIGGKGNDRLTGGKGIDTFVFGGRDGSDIITDFDARHEHIEIGSGATRFGQLTIAQSGADATVQFANTLITLLDTDADSLTKQVFDFT